MKKKQTVDEFMGGLEHPLKPEMEAVRRIILDVHPGITEQIKWAGPCFSYKDYLVTFNPRAKNHVHLVFHNGAILHDSTGLLEGDYLDRRMAYFRDMEEVKAKQPALESVIREWVALMDQRQGSSIETQIHLQVKTTTNTNEKAKAAGTDHP